MKYPITTPNILLILLGVVLIISGPTILIRTWKGFQRKKANDPSVKFQILGEGFNYAVGVLFFIWGILFVVNNLRGNPLV